MLAKPLTSEAIEFTEKKMDMTLDDIIKMSKDKATKGKKQRASNKNRNFLSGGQNKSMEVRQYLDSRSSLRQGALAKKRNNFQRNRFPLASEVAKKAIVAPFRNRAFNRNRPANWINRPRAGPPLRKQSNGSVGGIAINRQLSRRQHYQQQQTKPKTLDLLFANMKEQRMRALARPNNVGRGGMIGAQSGRQQPWGGKGQGFRN